MEEENEDFSDDNSSDNETVNRSEVKPGIADAEPDEKGDSLPSRQNLSEHDTKLDSNKSVNNYLQHLIQSTKLQNKPESEEDSYKTFLRLNPGSLREHREAARLRIDSVTHKKELLDLRQVLRDLQNIREMFEDGILLLNNLQAPQNIYEVIQQSLTTLLLGLQKHVAFQDQFLNCPETEDSDNFDPLKVLKQELTEYGGEFQQKQELSEYEGEYQQENFDKLHHQLDKSNLSEGGDDLKIGVDDEKLDPGSDIKVENQEIFETKGPVVANLKTSSKKSPSSKVGRKPGEKRRRVVPESDGSYLCHQCDQRFAKYQQLVRHLGRHNKPFKCDQCFKGFATKGDLVSHSMQVHDGERRFPCTVCPRKFFKKTDLERHIQMHNGVKPYKCEFCFHAFTTSGNLTKHVRRHTGEKPFACDVCPKAFVSTGDLVEHKRIHTGEKPFQCHICQKNFARTGHLKRHIKTHSGVKPYQCQVCQKCFTCRGNLKEHMNTHDRIKTE